MTLLSNRKGCSPPTARRQTNDWRQSPALIPDPCPLPSSLPKNLDQHPLRSPPIELPIKNLLPRAEVELAATDRHHDLATHNLPFVVRIGVVLARAIVLIPLRRRIE